MLGLKYGGEGSEKHYQLAILFTCPASIQRNIHCLQPKLVEVGVHTLCITGDKRYKVPTNDQRHRFDTDCMMNAGATGGAEPVHSIGNNCLTQESQQQKSSRVGYPRRWHLRRGPGGAL